MRIIFITILTVMIISIIAGIALLLIEKSFGYFIYGIIMVPFNVLVPTLIATYFYSLIKKLIKVDKGLRTFGLGVIILALVLQLGLIIWSVLDVLIYYSSFAGLTIENISSDYNSEFRGWNLLALIPSVVIPLIDRKIDNIKKARISEPLDMKYLKQTLNQLEKNVTKMSSTSYLESFLTKTVSELRDKPIEEFSIEDLRMMIGQNEGLKFLIPLAIEKLKENIFSEGDFYPGDLLSNLLQVPNSFWEQFPNEKKEMKELLFNNKGALNNLDRKIKELINSFLR